MPTMNKKEIELSLHDIQREIRSFRYDTLCQDALSSKKYPVEMLVFETDNDSNLSVGSQVTI